MIENASGSPSAVLTNPVTARALLNDPVFAVTLFSAAVRFMRADKVPARPAKSSYFVDTDLTAGLPVEKMPPSQVAEAVIAGISAGDEEIVVDDLTRAVKAGLSDDQALLYPMVEQQYLAAVTAGVAS